ncbi:MAG: ornithine carbamoyltransferase [Phycisphaerales bacterium]|nr:ornithine carbamoyltransferase [Phycisphaerales bacterium]
MANTFIPLGSKDLLTFASLSPREVAALFDTAAATKRSPAEYRAALAGCSVIMLFEKPSLRTRVTFEVGPARMGGHAIYYDHSKDRIGQRESVRDYAKNLERWVDCIVARVFSHAVLEELARETRVPVVNALSDLHHPCQGLADYLTLAERLGGITGLRGFELAYIGDGNNVCHSLMQGAALTGARLTVITPPGYEPSAPVVSECRTLAERHNTGGSVRVTTDKAGVRACRAVYTDTWVSMGQEGDAGGRRRAFEPYRVDGALMAAAAPGAWFMHCLPAHRGDEVTDAVIDSPASLVYDQAENRMHAQNALLLHLLASKD